MGKVAAQLMVITIISKLTGLFREMLFGAVYGTNMAKDIYVIGESTTAIAFSFLFLSLQSCFIPIYSDIKARSGREKADRFTANLTNCIFILALIIAIVFYIFMPQIISVLAKGYSGEKFTQTVFFCRATIWIILIRALVVAMISYLNIYNNFIVPATTGIIFNLLIMATAVIASRANSLTLLAIGTIIATALQYILFPAALRKTGYHHQLILQPSNSDLKRAMKIGIPVMFSILVNNISTIIDKAIASTIVTEGGISAMDYAAKFYDFIAGIVIVSIVTAVYPKLSSLIANHKVKAFRKLTASSLVSGLILVIPSTVGLMLYVEPLVRLFYERGAFTAESTAMTAGALFWYAPGLIGMIFIEILNRIYYSRNNARTPFFVSICQVTLDIILNFVLSRYFGLKGLAASTAIGNLFAAVLLLIFSRKLIGKRVYHHVFVSCGKILLATGAMAGVSWAVFQSLVAKAPTLALILAILVAILVYGLIILFLRMPEVQRVVNKQYHAHQKKKGSQR